MVLGCGNMIILNHSIPLNHENGRKDKKARTSTNFIGFVCFLRDVSFPVGRNLLLAAVVVCFFRVARF